MGISGTVACRDGLELREKSEQHRKQKNEEWIPTLCAQVICLPP